jgi:ribosomal protein S18 acetylase RimI-like enzyme
MIRQANMSDIDQIWQLREETRQLLKDRGIDQWQHGNPSRETFIRDIELGEFFVYDIQGEILGMIAIKSGIEKTYNVIFDGAWGQDRPYLTIHRLAVKRHLLGKHVSVLLMKFAEKLAIERQVNYIRIDTHRNNVYAKRLFLSLSYIERGYIMLEGDLGDLHRIALDKVIEVSS